MELIISCYSDDVFSFFEKNFFYKLNGKYKIIHNKEKIFFEIITKNNPKSFIHILLNTGLFVEKETAFYKPMFSPNLFFNLSNFSNFHLQIINNFLHFNLFNDDFFSIYNKFTNNPIIISSLNTTLFPPKPFNKIFSNQHLVPLLDNKKILILGNGPSLKEIDFMRVGIATMGMNSAYRYWEREGWYPDYYISMDDKLIESHNEAMREMVISKKVRGAFFNDMMFDRWHIELKKHPRVYSFGRVGNSKYFKSIDENKMTTGAWAVRFAAYLGFREIYIAGVDCNYVEILPESEISEDGSLEMVETPFINPNYFFDDYQRKGDKYNIPNPMVHNGRLHLDSFKILKEDIKVFDMGIEIYNVSEKSKLVEEGILNYVKFNL